MPETMPVRFPAISLEKMSPAQRAVAEAIRSGPRGSLAGPFNAMLRSPGLAEQLQRVGAHVRFNNVLPAKLRELAILVTARHWTAQYEWHAHRQLALEAGLDSAVTDAIAARRRPETLTAEESEIYDFTLMLLTSGGVDDREFDAVNARWGEIGVADLIGTVGYYCVVSFFLNVDRHPLPDGGVPLAP